MFEKKEKQGQNVSTGRRNRPFEQTPREIPSSPFLYDIISLQQTLGNQAIQRMMDTTITSLPQQERGAVIQRVKSDRRVDSNHANLAEALAEAKKLCGYTGQSDWVDVHDKITGEVTGKRSPDNKQEWMVHTEGHEYEDNPDDNVGPHVNWADWRLGKKDGKYGHCFYG